MCASAGVGRVRNEVECSIVNMDLLLAEESTWSSVGMEHVSGESIHSFLESAGQKKNIHRENRKKKLHC